jgi:hypothetical protein
MTMPFLTFSFPAALAFPPKKWPVVTIQESTPRVRDQPQQSVATSSLVDLDGELPLVVHGEQVGFWPFLTVAELIS